MPPATQHAVMFVCILGYEVGRNFEQLCAHSAATRGVHITPTVLCCRHQSTAQYVRGCGCIYVCQVVRSGAAQAPTKRNCRILCSRGHCKRQKAMLCDYAPHVPLWWWRAVKLSRAS